MKQSEREKMKSHYCKPLCKCRMINGVHLLTDSITEIPFDPDDYTDEVLSRGNGMFDQDNSVWKNAWDE